jgi:phage-related protein
VSSSSGFSVTTDTLQNVADTLEQINKTLNGFEDLKNDWHTAVLNCSTGRFDRSAFDSAGNDLKDFIGNFSNWVNKIQGEIENVSKSLKDAVKAYSDTESGLAKGLSGP